MHFPLAHRVLFFLFFSDLNISGKNSWISFSCVCSSLVLRSLSLLNLWSLKWFFFLEQLSNPSKELFPENSDWQGCCQTLLKMTSVRWCQWDCWPSASSFFSLSELETDLKVFKETILEILDEEELIEELCLSKWTDPQVLYVYYETTYFSKSVLCLRRTWILIWALPSKKKKDFSLLFFLSPNAYWFTSGYPPFQAVPRSLSCLLLAAFIWPLYELRANPFS